MISYQSSKAIEKAITFLVHAINGAGKNPKPVILHSIRVGLTLADLRYPIHVVQAGFLHDVIEDSDTNIEDIRERFGEKVATIVAACTNDPSKRNRTEQYQDTMRRAKEAGKDALVVMAADFFHNEPYYHQDDHSRYPWDKLKLFLDEAQPALHDEPIWKRLEPIISKIRNK